MPGPTSHQNTGGPKSLSLEGKRFTLRFENVMDFNFRCHMEQAIKNYGYKVIGGGADLHKKLTSIVFEGSGSSKDIIKRAIFPKRTTSG